MANILWAVVTFFLSDAVMAFLVLSALYALLVALVPILMSYLTGYLNLGSLNSLLGQIPDGVYWGFYFFRLDVGLPAMIAASVTRFLIRRLPVVG